MTMRLGVLGLGSVFWGPYASLIQRLTLEGKVELVARRTTSTPTSGRRRPTGSASTPTSTDPTSCWPATTSTRCWC